MEPGTMESTRLPPKLPSVARVHRSKRLKIDVACDTCRLRKVKCDGVRPACANCSKKLGQGDAACRYSSDGDGPREKGPQHEHHPRPLRPAASRMPSSQSPALSASNAPKQAVSTPEAVNAMVDSMTAVADDGVDTGEYFGSSSAGSFTAQIKEAIGARLNQTRPDLAGKPARPTAPSRRDLCDAEFYVLPPRVQADHLMGIYWFYVDPLYPFLHRPKWECWYASLFIGTPIDTDERIFTATLNIVFALSTQLVESLSAEARDKASHLYFQRAQGLLGFSVWDQVSLELVQYLLLTSQYLQSTSHPHKTWMVVGSAVRIAQSLGLQLPETSAEQTVPAQRELLRRIWHGCILMDRMVSVTHGRPAMVSEHLALAVPLPSTSPDPKSSKADLLTEASFFVKSVELYEITHKVTTALYSRHGPLSPRPCGDDYKENQSEDLGIVIQLDAAFSKWEDGLPNCLVLNHPNAVKTPVSYRQAVILRLRSLHSRMLLLRPILARVCLLQSSPGPSRPGDSLQERVMQQCARFCVETAQSNIRLLLKYQVSDGTVGMLPAWWYRIYYIFSAATVLIAAKLREDIFPPVDVNVAWDEAMQVLRAHENLGPSASRCVAALQILLSKVLRSARRTATPTSQWTWKEHDVEQKDHTAVGGNLAPNVEKQPSTLFPDLDTGDVSFNVDSFEWLNDVNAWDFLNG